MQLTAEYELTEIKTNFLDLKKETHRQVKKHSVKVTDENVPESKKVMANLNKVKAEIIAKYKHHIQICSQPIDQLKQEMKELIEIISEGREEIAKGVAEFEQVKLDSARKILKEYKQELCKEKGISEEAIMVGDLVKLGAITQNGNLSKVTRETIDSRFQAVENEILKAKLEAEEKAKRDKEIADKAREEEREKSLERERQRATQYEADKQKAVEEARQEVRTEVKQEHIPPQEEEKPQPKVTTKDGEVTYTVMATFKVSVKSHITEAQVSTAIRRKLEAQGITTLESVRVMGWN